MTRPSLVSTVALSVAAALGLALALAGGEDGHDFQGECRGCHLEDPGTGRPSMVRDNSTLCLRCHPEQQKLSHPVNVRPTMSMPRGWPLDSFGRLACTTCHAVHSREHAHRLRVPDAMEHFCRHCHADLVAGIDLHRRHGVSAHLQPGFGAEDGEGGLDDISKSCIACHDAIIGKGAGVSYLGDGLWEHGRSIGVTHPVGVLYREAASRNPVGFQPEGGLPEEIRLFDGRVGCASCHSPYSDRKDQVVYRTEGSRLCLACHRK